MKAPLISGSIDREFRKLTFSYAKLRQKVQ